jgi:ribosomal subunit interface protein
MECVNNLRYNIRFKKISSSEKDKSYIEEKIVSKVAKYFDDPSTVIDITLEDINGPKGGIDKQINIVVDIKGESKPIKITQKDVYVKESIDKAAERLEKVLRRQKDKIVKSIKNNKK